MSARRAAPFALTLLAAVALPLAAQDGIPAAPKAVDRANQDTTCAPCKDFARFANGAWEDRTEIPPQYPGYGASYMVFERTQAQLRAILNQAATQASSTTDPTIRRLGLFYGSCMDSSAVERDGLTPVLPALRRIDAIRDRKALMAEIGRLHRLGAEAAFGTQVFADLKNSRMQALYLTQGGLRLPDRDYYLRDDEKLAKARADYVDHMERLLVLGGTSADQTSRLVEQVLRLETALAQSGLPADARRDPNRIYNPMTPAELAAKAPALDWTGYFTALGIAPPAKVIVETPAQLTTLDSLARTTPLEVWRAYLRNFLLARVAPRLDSRFQQEALAFSKIVSGVSQLRPRWQRCTGAVDQGLGEVLGRAFVEKHFGAAAKAKALALVGNLRAVLRERLQQLDWMSEETKRTALAKLDRMREKIAYPDRWRSYDRLAVAKGPWVVNSMNSWAFETAYQLGKVGKPVDRSEWYMTPQTLNAYADPTQGEIVFPAGILMPPFFDPDADDAVNYGAIGAVIGHEITHHFDDQGRRYDAEGNLKDWWTAADSLEFNKRAQLVVDQYNGFTAVDTLKVNGKLTLGENIADIGGLTIAYEAWQRSLAGKPAPQPIDGFTPAQRFFLAYATAWQSKDRDESIRSQVLSDPHSPARWRINGVVQHLQAFQDAFGCKAGDAMHRGAGQRMAIW